MPDHPTATPVFWQDWQARGIVQQATQMELGSWMAQWISSPEGLSCYCGFDPTADSLHIGSLMPALGLRRMKQAGVRPIAVVGGGTGMIGDPSGKSAERSLLAREVIGANTAAIARQLETLLEGKAGADFLVVDNIEWLGPLTLLDFLRDVGKHFSINAMIKKESVRARLEEREHGISYTEFSYMLLQAYDFLNLFETRGCRMQIGGSDQWGNITAGIDLIHHRHHGAEVGGLVFPLITTAEGQKFGKSERGNIWLDPDKTHPYFLFQYFLQAGDADVGRFLRYFTFLSIDEIAALEEQTRAQPERRAAQWALASEVTGLVHGPEVADACAGLERAMHADDEAACEIHADRLGLLDPSNARRAAASGDLPVVHRPRSELAGAGLSVVDLAVEVGLFQSKSEVRREIGSKKGGFRVAGQPVMEPDFRLTAQFVGPRRVVQLRKGKKNKRMICFSE